MILLVVVVQSEDITKLSQRLIEDKFRLTRINATGGFLAAGSAVLLIGVEDERVPAIAAIIEATCLTRTSYVNAAPWPGMAGAYAMGMVSPMEVLVGGAVVFGLPVQRFLRLTGSPESPGSDPLAVDKPTAGTAGIAVSPAAPERMTDVIPATDPATDPTVEPEGVAPVSGGKPGTKLVVAIVQNEDSDAVVNALMGAGYRLTRINTAGGFLRRGNATLLIGVEAHRLEDVLALIQGNCRLRTEPAPIHEGMPTYGATVFVLDASHFLRF